MKLITINNHVQMMTTAEETDVNRRGRKGKPPMNPLKSCITRQYTCTRISIDSNMQSVQLIPGKLASDSILVFEFKRLPLLKCMEIFTDNYIWHNYKYMYVPNNEW